MTSGGLQALEESKGQQLPKEVHRGPGARDAPGASARSAVAHDGHAAPAPGPRKLALWENVVLGGASAAIAGTAVYPLDTVKARLMNGQGASIGAAVRGVLASGGPLALYRGLPAQLVGIMPEKALKLTLYNTLRQAQMDPATQKVTYPQEALAGLGTACVQVAITQPYELVKLRQQTVAGQSLGDTIRQLGLRGLTRGTSATLLRDMPFNMMYFSSYAALKDLIHAKCDPPGQPLISPQGLMAAGLGAGLIAGGLTTPPDVIKTRMQADTTGRYKGLFDCIRQMWAEGGSRAFMIGLGPRLALIPPMFAITMTCFETFQRVWFPDTVVAPKTAEPRRAPPREAPLAGATVGVQVPVPVVGAAPASGH